MHFLNFLESEDNLNKEERAFVETNAGLFDPELVSAGKKRTKEDEDANALKKRKPSSDEVSLYSVEQFFIKIRQKSVKLLCPLPC